MASGASSQNNMQQPKLTRGMATQVPSSADIRQEKQITATRDIAPYMYCD